MEAYQDSIKKLFKHEFSRMVAVISNRFGLPHIELAEDIVSETFLAATENWKTRGIPINPTAWLYAVAKQKTLYHFRRDKIFVDKILPRLKTADEEISEMEDIDFSAVNIRDSTLRMMFAVCTPSIASEAQIALALRVLCGFGIEEIAEAFFTSKETINKRLSRAKEKLRAEQISLELPSEIELERRLDSVLHIIYLLFNEGYYSKTQNEILRKDLCFEAMRLGVILTEYDKTNTPKTNALMALMCFHASRFDARHDPDANMILYDQQDRELWDPALIRQGLHYLELSVQGKDISSYHLEARIAWWHCMPEDSKEKWEDILSLYDQLLQLNYSPAVALNRIFALSRVYGPGHALIEAEKLRCENNHFYFLMLGELYKTIDVYKSQLNLQKAYSLAKTETERKKIGEKLIINNE